MYKLLVQDYAGGDLEASTAACLWVASPALKPLIALAI